VPGDYLGKSVKVGLQLAADVFGLGVERLAKAAYLRQVGPGFFHLRILADLGGEFFAGGGLGSFKRGLGLLAGGFREVGNVLSGECWWDGKQVIAESQMSALRVATGPNPGHGAFLWLNTEGGYSLKPSSSAPAGSPGGFIYHGGHREMVAAMGAGPSRMYIIPGRDAVIVRQTLGDTGTFVDTEFLELLLGSDPVP